MLHTSGSSTINEEVEPCVSDVDELKTAALGLLLRLLMLVEGMIVRYGVSFAAVDFIVTT